MIRKNLENQHKEHMVMKEKEKMLDNIMSDHEAKINRKL